MNMNPVVGGVGGGRKRGEGNETEDFSALLPSGCVKQEKWM